MRWTPNYNVVDGVAFPSDLIITNNHSEGAHGRLSSRPVGWMSLRLHLRSTCAASIQCGNDAHTGVFNEARWPVAVDIASPS